jgi:hypothetical protein
MQVIAALNLADAQLRVAQYRLACRDETVREMARLFVDAKLENGRVLLRRRAPATWTRVDAAGALAGIERRALPVAAPSPAPEAEAVRQAGESAWGPAPVTSVPEAHALGVNVRSVLAGCAVLRALVDRARARSPITTVSGHALHLHVWVLADERAEIPRIRREDDAIIALEDGVRRDDGIDPARRRPADARGARSQRSREARRGLVGHDGAEAIDRAMNDHVLTRPPRHALGEHDHRDVHVPLRVEKSLDDTA